MQPEPSRSARPGGWDRPTRCVSAMLAAGGDGDEHGAGYAGRTMRDVELPPLWIAPPVSPAPGSSLSPAVTRESAAREMHRWLELHGSERGDVGLPAGLGGRI